MSLSAVKRISGPHLMPILCATRYDGASSASKATMRRREFITLLGSTAAAWPLRAWAQQPAMPTIGFMGALTASGRESQIAAFHQGLKEAGYKQGRNIAIEKRWAEGHFDRLPAMAAEMVQR